MKILIVMFSSLLYRVEITFDCWKGFNNSHCFYITDHYIDHE